MAPLKLARSLGPRQLIKALEDRVPLNASDQEVTFLAIIDPARVDECDVWDYGCGQELGVYLFPEADHLPLQNLPREEDRHDPGRWPEHVWIWNEDHTLRQEDAVLVRSPDEMIAALTQGDAPSARAHLDAIRDSSQRAIEEELLAGARELHARFERWRDRAKQIEVSQRQALAEVLLAQGISPHILEKDPAHLSPNLRRLLEELDGWHAQDPARASG